jgi:hypothetical protein
MLALGITGWLLFLGAVGAFVCGKLVIRVSGQGNCEEAHRDALRQFDLARRAERRTVEQRRNAAAKLVHMSNGGAFAVMILAEPAVLGDYSCPGGSEAMRKGLHSARNAVVAAMLEEVGPESGDALLWAATHWLKERDTATYSKSVLLPWPATGECITRPMQELAREALSRALGADMEYDEEAWRELILRRGGAR